MSSLLCSYKSISCTYSIFEVYPLWITLNISYYKRMFSITSSQYKQNSKVSSTVDLSSDTQNVSFKTKAIFNDLKIQMLSNSLNKQIFENNTNGKHMPKNDDKNVKKSILNLQKHGLWGKETSIMKNVNLILPKLYGNNLDEHFRLLGESQCNIYKKLLSYLIDIKIPHMPKTWNFTPGWTRYNEFGEPIQVKGPECSALVFDIEVCMSEGKHPTLACAMSDKYWYSWCSKDLIDSSLKKDLIALTDLIPLRHVTSSSGPKVIVGHNVSFDRRAIQEEYLIEDSNIRFVDTMSMHIAVSGLVEEQRGIILKNKKAENKIRLPWMSVGSQNSLKDVLYFYCKKELKKESRNVFVKGTLGDVQNNFQELMLYCALDVKATQNVLNKLLPLFFDRFPHPVTFAGMLEMSTAYLPVSDNWNQYKTSAEDEYNQLKATLNSKLIEQALKALELKEGEKYKDNLWLWDLDWNLPTSRVKTLKNYPNWYRNMCKKAVGLSSDEIAKPLNMSTSLRIVPKLLHLTWNGYPLHFNNTGGWGFLKPANHIYQNDLRPEELEPLNSLSKAKFPLKSLKSLNNTLQNSSVECFTHNQKSAAIDIGIPNVEFFPLPHKNGEGNRVGNPLAKDFLRKLEDGTLSSAVPNVAELVLKITKTISYWKNNRDRILSQFVIWLPYENLPRNVTQSADFNSTVKCGSILPQVITAGTITRRAVEKTWMTASNAYSDRIGSELKAMIKAPPGYHFVGADVDSQELWIASVLGDAYYSGIHGSTAFGWMTLQGNKSEGTDMHSKTAETAGISRNNAKIVNYARIYGAGQNFMQRLLKQFNPNLSDDETKERAAKLFAATKGEKGWHLNEEGKKIALEVGFPYHGQPLIRREIFRLSKMSQLKGYDFAREEFVSQIPVWVGGSESEMFNCLENIARTPHPCTPVLGAHITRALEPWCVDDQFMTSRVNWVVQSSAVDFLHLMLVCMRWLFSEYKINGRFSISIHDEVRYLVASEDRYRAALALHITNLLTRSFISMRLGFSDLPLSIAFFGGVDIDTVLRKEPDMDCVTPSNPSGLQIGYNVPKGETLTIHQVIEKTNENLEPVDI